MVVEAQFVQCGFQSLGHVNNSVPVRHGREYSQRVTIRSGYECVAGGVDDVISPEVANAPQRSGVGQLGRDIVSFREVMMASGLQPSKPQSNGASSRWGAVVGASVVGGRA